MSTKTCESHRDLSSDSLAVQRMAHALLVELSDSVMDALVEIVCSGEGLMSEMVSFQIAPGLFDVVEFGSVFWQPLDCQPVRSLGKRGARCLAGVDRAVVEREDGRLERDARLGPEASVKFLQQRDEVRAALSCRSLYFT